MSLEEINSEKKNTEKKIKKFKCEKCLKIFSTNGNLKNHINTIHNKILPFKCPISNCLNSYSNKSRLEVHLRTHSGIKPYSCPICKKLFNEKGNLKTHILFHTNVRPFKCPHCNKSYKTNGHLKDHIDILHFKIKKFHCQICGVKFGRRSTLTAHVKIHFDKNYLGNEISKSNNYGNLKCNSSSSTSLVSYNNDNYLIHNNFMKNDINDNNINNLCDNYHFQINGKIFFFNNYRKKIRIL